MAYKTVIANWKMNPQTYDEAEKLLQRLLRPAHNQIMCSARNDSLTIICPPFTWLTDLSHKYADQIHFGAQDVFWENEGSYTGEISPAMLKNSKVEYVIIGHSERRRHLSETDEMIGKKISAALKNGLKPILCVGEPKRESRIKNYELKKAKAYVKNQLQKDLKNIHNSKFIIHNSLIVAYEPVWAVGTGTPDKPEDAAEMIKFIKRTLNAKPYTLNPKVIYGGSVSASNAESFLKHPEIDGLLVGLASLKAEEFIKILKIANV